MNTTLRYPYVLSPLNLGFMRLKNCILVPTLATMAGMKVHCRLAAEV